MAPEPKKMVRLRSSDGVAFEVPEESICAASGTIKGMLEAGRAAADVIPLPEVTAAMLSRVLEYVHEYNPQSPFHDEFLQVDKDTLFNLMLAARYLDMEGLLNLACEAVAKQIDGMTVEEIRQYFHIVNDFTKEEEEEIRRNYAWAFE